MGVLSLSTWGESGLVLFELFFTLKGVVHEECGEGTCLVFFSGGARSD